MNTPSRKKAVTGAVAFLITAACLAAVFIPPQALASGSANMWQRQAMNKPAPHRSILGIWRSAHLIQKLALTEDQVKQLRDADFTARETKLELDAELSRLRLQFEKMMAADTLEDKAVLKLAKKIAALNGRQFLHEVESDLAVGNILNADQVKALKLLSGHQRKQNINPGRKYLPSGCTVEKKVRKGSAAL